MKARSSIPPWKRPGWVLWFVLAAVCSCWFILHMPVDSRRMRDAPTTATQTADASPARGALGGVLPTQASGQPSDAERIFMKLETFGRLFAIVGIAAFCGGLMEARQWHMVLALLMGRLTRMARLPEIVGLAMPTALCSNAAANSILVSSHAEGQIRTSALIAGGMMNSYLAYISHSIRVMFPVIGAIGLPGVLYFGMQFTGGFLVLLCILLWNRWYVSRHGESPCATESGSASQPVPLMLGIEWLLKNGVLDFWETALPHAVTELFPTELLSAVAAQFGGLVQSSAVAANLRAEGLIDNSQILLAMLVGSALGNPFRALRRNLPSALAIFPVPIALSIVLGMQLSRFLVTLAGIAGVVWMMLNTP